MRITRLPSKSSVENWRKWFLIELELFVLESISLKYWNKSKDCTYIYSAYLSIIVRFRGTIRKNHYSFLLNSNFSLGHSFSEERYFRMKFELCSWTSVSLPLASTFSSVWNSFNIASECSREAHENGSLTGFWTENVYHYFDGNECLKVVLLLVLHGLLRISLG